MPIFEFVGQMSCAYGVGIWKLQSKHLTHRTQCVQQITTLWFKLHRPSLTCILFCCLIASAQLCLVHFAYLFTNGFGSFMFHTICVVVAWLDWLSQVLFISDCVLYHWLRLSILSRFHGFIQTHVTNTQYICFDVFHLNSYEIHMLSFVVVVSCTTP